MKQKFPRLKLATWICRDGRCKSQDRNKRGETLGDAGSGQADFETWADHAEVCDMFHDVHDRGTPNMLLEGTEAREVCVAVLHASLHIGRIPHLLRVYCSHEWRRGNEPIGPQPDI